MIKYFLTFLISLPAFFTFETTLSTKYGTVGGFKYTTVVGTFSEIFLGIPYAKPPINELRFEIPEPPSPWHTPHNGTTWGHQCVPTLRSAVIPGPETSEDCLTLNVFRPEIKATTKRMPILIYVHGGGFSIGSAYQMGYKGFANIYNTKGVIVVTVQYRLGVYGFISVNGISRNLGLFDLAEALKFVHENAELFHGDPSRITIMGQSAGSVLVGHLTASPYSRDYIRQSIQISGSPIGGWARGTVQNEEEGRNLTKDLHCDNDDIKECMKSKTVDEIYDALVAIEPFGRTVLRQKFGPRFDGDFFPKETEELLKTTRNINTIIGVTDNEVSLYSMRGKGSAIQPFNYIRSLLGHFDMKMFEWTIQEKVALPDLFKDDQPRVVKRLIEDYAPKAHDSAALIRAFTDIISDVWYTVPAAIEANIRVRNGDNVFIYLDTHYDQAIWPSGTPESWKGAPHSEEYPYLFGLFPNGNYSLDTPQEKIVTDVWRQSIVSFIKTGKPKNDHVKWRQATTDAEYLEISPTPRMKQNFNSDASEFWHDLGTLDYDLIRGRPLDNFRTMGSEL